MTAQELATKHCIFKAITGSHVYGTSRPDSDLDTRGIFIPPLEYYLGLENVEQVKFPNEIKNSLVEFIELN